jgi:hypothetical protein
MLHGGMCVYGGVIKPFKFVVVLPSPEETEDNVEITK